jgi:uncharacterized UPF0160 family protein
MLWHWRHHMTLQCFCYFMAESPTQKKVIVHNGTFHADDVFAVAALKILFPDLVVVRTRDEALIATADIVADVGSIYDPAQDRFDHHQQGGAGARSNGIPYAAIGLVWKKYGEQITGSRAVADIVDTRLIAPIDGPDNGVALAEAKFPGFLPYTPGAIVEAWNPTWKEDESSADERFADAVSLASRILEREIIQARDAVAGQGEVRTAYDTADDKRLIIITRSGLPWRDVLTAMSEPLFVVMPAGDRWKVRTVPSGLFKNRKDLPRSWAGLRDAELSVVTSVPDALFCHNKLFIAVAGSREGAIALAQRALASPDYQ